jgi:hypothetical protein
LKWKILEMPKYGTIFFPKGIAAVVPIAKPGCSALD